MAQYGDTVLNIADWTKRLAPDGSIAVIGELLSERNEVLEDMQWKEGNLPTGERVTVRTSLPSASWRLLNQGVGATKSTTAQVDESCGMLEAWSEVDKDLAMLNGNTSGFRLSEAIAHVEGMNQEFTQTLFYGDQSLAPEEFTGLRTRFNSTSAANAENVIECDDTPTADESTSLWCVVWGPDVYGIFPKGSQAGLVHEDLGLVTVESSAGIGGNRLRAYQDHFQWKCGLVVKDWRQICRAANIDVPALHAYSTAVDLGAVMVKMIHKIHALNGGRVVFYGNRTTAEKLDLQARSSVSGGALATADTAAINPAFSTQYGAGSYSNYEGRQVRTFRGIPFKVCDQLLTTEAAYS